MPLNVLIDTCSWSKLITEGDNRLLNQLENMIKNNHINLITHKLINDEWNKAKDFKIRDFKASLKDSYDKAKNVLSLEKLALPYSIQPNITPIEQQINTINRLLEGATLLTTPDPITILCVQKSLQRKAPFHNKKDSLIDGLFIFTALDYFNSKSENLIFISDNKSDFGSPNNLTREIHPEIVEGYSNINIDYFAYVGEAISFISQKNNIISYKQLDFENLTIYLNDIEINKSKPILDQIYDYILERYKEIQFVPIKVLIQHYPFKKHSDSHIDYSDFTVSTDNEELFELFKSVVITDENKVEILDYKICENVINPEEKLKKIISTLSQNLIFNIGNNNKVEKYSIRYFEKSNSESPLLDFKKFKFVDSLNSFDTEPSDVKDLMQLAYLSYQIGSYLKANQLLVLAYNKALESQMLLKAFIIQYNRSNLQNFIRNNYYGVNSQSVLLAELKSINLSTEIHKIENKKIIDWIQNKEFYNIAKEKIHNLSSNLIDSYYSQLNGGWSSNNDVWLLVNEYAVLESFLNENSIIFDKFSEFSKLSAAFFEGLFASHSIQENQGNRLEAFDDYLLVNLLYYTESKFIKKMFGRYKLKNIKYKSNTDSEYSFEKLVSNFFYKNDNITNKIVEVGENSNWDFWNYYNKIFCNILTIVSICDFSQSYYNKFSKQLLDFLEKGILIRQSNKESIIYFLEHVSSKIESTLLKRFFFLFLENEKYHDGWIFDTMSNILISKSQKVKINQKQFDSIKNIALEKCSKCKHSHPKKWIIFLHECISNKLYKQKIVNLIHEQLEIDFDFDLFYLSTILDVIDFNEDYFRKIINLLNFEYLNGDYTSFGPIIFTKKQPKRNPYLNSIINLCFKFDIDTTISEFNKSKELDEYYKWLLDMDNYDYSKFQPLWINEYVTKYYSKKIGKSRHVKVAMEEFLKKNFDSKIESIYLNIYVRKSWKK